jgi:hypothetical protein
MSTKADLRLDTYKLLNEDDPLDPTNSNPTNTHFSAVEIDDYVQKGITLLGTELEWAFQVSQAVAVQDQALYELPDDFIALTDAYFDNNPLTILERGDLKALSAAWQNAPSGTPYVAYKADNKVVGIYPPPDASQAGKAIQIEYIAIPATLATDSAVPDIHTAFQLCLPFYAAYRAQRKFGNDKVAALHFGDYEIHRKKLMSKIQNWSPALMRFRWGGNYGR